MSTAQIFSYEEVRRAQEAADHTRNRFIFTIVATAVVLVVVVALRHSAKARAKGTSVPDDEGRADLYRLTGIGAGVLAFAGGAYFIWTQWFADGDRPPMA